MFRRKTPPPDRRYLVVPIVYSIGGSGAKKEAKILQQELDDGSAKGWKLAHMQGNSLTGGTLIVWDVAPED